MTDRTFGRPDEDTDRVPRMWRLLDAVRTLMADEQWRTLADIHAHTGGSEASISARLRDLRKPQFGHYHVERRHVRGGLYEYRVTVRVPECLVFGFMREARHA